MCVSVRVTFVLSFAADQHVHVGRLVLVNDGRRKRTTGKRHSRNEGEHPARGMMVLRATHLSGLRMNLPVTPSTLTLHDMR